MLVATFGPTTGWAGKAIGREGEEFVLGGYGPITAADIMEHDRQGHLLWAGDRTRAWVDSLTRQGVAVTATTARSKEEQRAIAEHPASRSPAPVPHRRSMSRLSLAIVGGLLLVVVVVALILSGAIIRNTGSSSPPPPSAVVQGPSAPAVAQPTPSASSEPVDDWPTVFEGDYVLPSWGGDARLTLRQRGGVAEIRSSTAGGSGWYRIFSGDSMTLEGDHEFVLRRLGAATGPYEGTYSDGVAEVTVSFSGNTLSIDTAITGRTDQREAFTISADGERLTLSGGFFGSGDMVPGWHHFKYVYHRE